MKSFNCLINLKTELMYSLAITFPSISVNLYFVHGQSFIERGFNINKEHLVDNLQEESLIALHTVNDYIIANSLSPTMIQISKKMQTSVGLSRQRYVQALEEKKKIERTTIKLQTETGV